MSSPKFDILGMCGFPEEADETEPNFDIVGMCGFSEEAEPTFDIVGMFV